MPPRRGRKWKPGAGGTREFDPTDFDVDMFAVMSDAKYQQALMRTQLAEGQFLTLGHLSPRGKELQSRMLAKLLENMPGHRDRFSVRLFSQSEWDQIRHKNHPFRLFTFEDLE